MLDHCFTDLEPGDDGRACVDARSTPRTESRSTLWVDESYPYLMLFTGDPLPDVHRHSLAVEPMTCPPNAFRSGDSLTRLEPGASTTGSWGIAASAVGSARSGLRRRARARAGRTATPARAAARG